MTALDIGEVARRSGVPASTLRFYEEKGLIGAVGRRGLRRMFAPAVLDRLALIALGRAAGFSLEEVARFQSERGLTQTAATKTALGRVAGAAPHAWPAGGPVGEVTEAVYE